MLVETVPEGNAEKEKKVKEKKENTGSRDRIRYFLQQQPLRYSLASACLPATTQQWCGRPERTLTERKKTLHT